MRNSELRNRPPVAANLKLALKEAGMTQEALAREIDVPLRVVQEWCGGRATPRWWRLMLAAEALGKEPAWFYVDHEETAAA